MCCGKRLSNLKDSICEQLEIIPAKLFVKRHIKKNYCCSNCDIFLSGNMPKQPIPKSIAGVGLLSHVIVSKYQDHLPLYRMENILNRFGVDVARCTLASWMIKSADLLEPMYRLLLTNINSYDVAYSDETTVQILKEPDRKAQHKSYMWVFGGGSKDKRCFVYVYKQGRSSDVPAEVLSNFSGYLHCDGYSGYETYAKYRNVLLVACWHHARRKFIDVQKVTKKKTGLSGKLLSIIKKLAKIEGHAAELSLEPEQIYELRQKKSMPLLLEYKKLLDENVEKTPPKSLLGKAIKYSLNQWEKLIRFVEDGRLENSNNLMERKVKPFVIGRKNWLFYDSVSGAKAGSIIYSLIETCKEHGIEPYYWFKYVFENIHSMQEKGNFEDYLPYNIDKSLVKPSD